MEDAAKKEKFDQLVALVSELQAKWTNPEIHMEPLEELLFELNQDKLGLERDRLRLK